MDLSQSEILKAIEPIVKVKTEEERKIRLEYANELKINKKTHKTKISDLIMEIIDEDSYNEEMLNVVEWSTKNGIKQIHFFVGYGKPKSNKTKL